MKVKRSISTSLLVLFMSLFFLAAVPTGTASAATLAGCDAQANVFGLPKWYKYLGSTWEAGSGNVPGSCKVNFKPDRVADYGKVGLALFEVLMRIGVLIAVAFVIYGGILYSISQGRPTRSEAGGSVANLSSAKNIITSALIGLVIAMSAVTIMNVIFRNLAQ